MNTIQNTSATATVAHKIRRQAARTLCTAMLGTVLMTAAGPGFAREKAEWQVRSDSAYFTVYAYHCAPNFLQGVASLQPDGMHVAVLESRFRVDFDGNCRAFFLSEIAQRIDTSETDVAAVSR